MEFKGQYLTYQEYKALGGTLDEMPFNLLEFNARKKIDERTFGRLIKRRHFNGVWRTISNLSRV